MKTYYGNEDTESDTEQLDGGEDGGTRDSADDDEGGQDVDIFEQWALRPKLTTMYRTTTLGRTLVESLEELVAKDKLPMELSNLIMGQFDRKIMATLKDKLGRKSRLGFQAEELKTYRCIQGIWTFVLYGVEFRKRYSFLNVDKMKVTAVEKTGPRKPKKRWYSSGTTSKP